MFGPVARVFRAVAEMESAPSARFDVPAATPAAPDAPTVGSSGQQNGDVTDAIAPKATPREKADLVEKLNADAKKQQQQEIKRIVHEQAAAILRNRVVSLSSAESAKVFMETSNRGLVARTIVIDVTKPRSRQSGVKSRTPSAEHPSLARTSPSWEAVPQGKSVQVVCKQVAHPSLH